MLAKVELPYRVIDVATGDLGSSAARKFDCEAWIPTQGDYREVTSTSNCTTFQARRLADPRCAPRDGVTRRVATLNGTLRARRAGSSRILENHQQADGSVRVPEALRPYLGGRDVLAPVCVVSRRFCGLRLIGLTPGWLAPALVALDIDGTIVPSDSDRCPPAVVAAVRRAVAAGVACGARHRPRRPGHPVGRRAARARATSRRSAATVRSPRCPARLEVLARGDVRPGPAVRLVQQSLPEAIVAVERPGIGYAVTRPFPDGRGQRRADRAQRSRRSSRCRSRGWSSAGRARTSRSSWLAVEAAGLHGVNYAIGYSAWLDVMPPGVSKASALEVVRVRTSACRPDVPPPSATGNNDREMLEWAAHARGDG